MRKNHRQGEDKKYADILNRTRTAELTEEDVKELESRVFSTNDPRIPPDAPVITCTNAEVNRINTEKLDLMNGREFVIDSINKNTTQKEFQPRTDASGAVKGTPLQKQLKVKNKAKVMLTYNVDTTDCLTNGAFGEIVGFEFAANDSIRLIYVHFNNPEVGKERRRNNVEIQKKFPDKNVVGIEKLEFSYSLSKKANGRSTAVAYQFPLRLAFASTAHKVQGLTVKKPTPLVVDLRSVRESAQAYVILSRVQSKDQLYILESLCPEKISASSLAIAELKRMTEVAVNMKNVGQKSVVSCNIRSFKKNFDDLRLSTAFNNAEVICLQETWLELNEYNLNLMSNEGFDQRNVCVGKGRGITTFFDEKFMWKADVKKNSFQMTKIESEDLVVINLYRSTDSDDDAFISKLNDLFNSQKQLMILGDFNLCYKEQRLHSIFQFLQNSNFQQIVERPTHTEGRIIDLVFVRTIKRKPNYRSKSTVLH